MEGMWLGLMMGRTASTVVDYYSHDSSSCCDVV